MSKSLGGKLGAAARKLKLSRLERSRIASIACAKKNALVQEEITSGICVCGRPLRVEHSNAGRNTRCVCLGCEKRTNECCCERFTGKE